MGSFRDSVARLLGRVPHFAGDRRWVNPLENIPPPSGMLNVDREGNTTFTPTHVLPPGPASVQLARLRKMVAEREAFLSRRRAMASSGITVFVVEDARGITTHYADGRRFYRRSPVKETYLSSEVTEFARRKGASFVVRFKAYKPEFLARVSMRTVT